MGEVKSLTPYWLTSLWFHVPFLSYSIFQIWPRKYKVKATAQGRKVGITPYLPFPFLGYIYFKISKFDVENSRSRSRVRSELKVKKWIQLTFGPLTSFLFLVNRASHSWVSTFFKFDLENQGSKAWVGPQFKVIIIIIIIFIDTSTGLQHHG